MITGQCGPLRAYEVASANNTFTSQLNVTIIDEVVGKTVQCLYDDGGMEAIVGTDNITLSSGQKYIHCTVDIILCVRNPSTDQTQLRVGILTRVIPYQINTNKFSFSLEVLYP